MVWRLTFAESAALFNILLNYVIYMNFELRSIQENTRIPFCDPGLADICCLIQVAFQYERLVKNRPQCCAKLVFEYLYV